MYSLRKCRKILKMGCDWYETSRHTLSTSSRSHFETLLARLNDALLRGDRVEADPFARQVESFCAAHFKKGAWAYIKEGGGALLIALLIATIVRQMWFELYEIPTGSMRPTFKEQDHLTVTKTAFGLNTPLDTSHFYFDPNLVQREGVVIWSGDKIPHLDADSRFLSIFPYTKRYIKRCMGKPGDTLYFYGGQLYGMDREGRDLKELRESPWTASLEYLPFTHFEGRRSYIERPRAEVLFHHFNRSLGRLSFGITGFKGEIFNGKEWVTDKPEAQRQPHDTLQTFSDFWGMRNIAQARLLTPEQATEFYPDQIEKLEKGLLYLELRHTPSLSFPPPLLSPRFGVFISGYQCLLPLQEAHLQALRTHLYTCRFVVKGERASPYRVGERAISATSPLFSNVPNGTYEFYYGKGVKVGWGGITSPLPSNHPLYDLSPLHLQQLFNLGIEMDTEVAPHSASQPLFPNRYAYFRQGDLYVMGGLVMTKEDPLLHRFHEREKQREKESSLTSFPYVAFKDYGPPLTTEGELDRIFLRTFGYRVPEGHYLMLGDNHAMSQDSRYFGPIPEENLQGAPSLILWPPVDRWGYPHQRPYPLFTLPRIIVWGIAASIGLICFIVHRRRLRRPLFHLRHD